MIERSRVRIHVGAAGEGRRGAGGGGLFSSPNFLCWGGGGGELGRGGWG